METCITEGCSNERCEFDFRKMCLECNPFGDSLVMNNDPEYQSWLFRAESDLEPELEELV